MPPRNKVPWAERICTGCGKAERYSTNSYCKECHRENSRKYMAKIYDSEKNRKVKLKRYGITPEIYDDMMEAQGGKCWICEAIPGKRPLCVDHCHNSDKVRGLLCNSCNTMLGYAYDNPEILRRGIEYLQTQEKGEA